MDISTDSTKIIGRGKEERVSSILINDIAMGGHCMNTSKFEFYHCFETPNMHWLDCRMNDVGQRVCFMAEYFLLDMSKLKCLPLRYWSGKKFHFIAVHGPIFVLPEMQ